MSLLPDFIKGIQESTRGAGKKGKIPDPACKPVPPRDPPPVRPPEPFCTTAGTDAEDLMKVLRTIGKR